MTKQEMMDMRDILFNENFSIKTDNVEDVKDFCKELTDITGVQCCNAFGYTNELLPRVYYSALGTLEE